METLPSYETETVQHAPRHVPIQMPYCLLCRFPIQPSESVRAVLGIDGLDSSSEYTCNFQFPKHQAGGPVGGSAELKLSSEPVQVYGGDKRASNWVLCRSQLCKACGDTETYLHHIDCHAAIAARGHPLSLQELWTLGTWTRPVPGVPYQADVRSLLATAISSLGKESDAMLPEFSEICGLPWELREMIASHSIESPLWKILSALHRFGKVKKLLQHGEDEHVIDIANIKEWQRGIGGDMSGTAQNHSDMVRVYLDDYGIQRIEQFSSESASYTQARMHTATWYIVEPLSVMGNVQVHVKGDFMRLKNSGSLQIWDTPDPPPPPLRWYDNAYIPRSIRCIDLQGAASLSVYCYNGRAFCIKPHQHTGQADDPPEFMLHSIKSQDIVRLSVPLQNAGDAESFWVQDHRPWQDDSLLLVTSSGRVHVLGSCRHRILSGITPLAGNPRYILLPAADDGSIARNFGVSAACKVPGWRSAVVDTALQCNPHTMRRLMAAPTYMATASAEDVIRVRVYRRPCAALCDMNLCVGLALEYADGGCERLGVCGEQQKQQKQQQQKGKSGGDEGYQAKMEVDVVERPVALYYQYVGSAAMPGMLVQCSGAERGSGDMRLCGSGWLSRPFRGTVRLFFTKDSIVSIE